MEIVSRAVRQLIAGGCFLIVLCAQVEAQVATETGSPQFETLTLKSGMSYEGFLQSKSDEELTFVQIVRRPGKPMGAVVRVIPADQVQSYAAIDEAERQQLEMQVNQLRHRVAIEAGDIERVELVRSSDAQPEAWGYVGPWFRLQSTADNEATRRCVVRIEQIFRAYRQMLPPHPAAGPPIRIMLFGSVDEYQTALRMMGAEIDNLALYASRDRTIFAGTELVEYSRRLRQIREAHAELLRKADRDAGDFRDKLKAYSERLVTQGFDREQIKAELARRNAAWKREQLSLKRRISETNRRNDAAFDEVADAMFRRLYHEAFHAYLDAFVIADKDRKIDRWLNEGMAQIFESGQLDGDSLRIDAPNKSALETLQRDLAASNSLTLAELLTSTDRDFLAFHNRASTAKHYAYAWGLAYYITMERKLLRPWSLAAFMSRPEQSPIGRFGELIDQPLGEFEIQWRAAMLAL